MRHVFITAFLGAIVYGSAAAQVAAGSTTQAVLSTANAISIPGNVPILTLSLRNSSNGPLHFGLSNIVFYVALDGMVIHPTVVERFYVPNCSQKIDLQPDQSKVILCGNRVSNESYSVGSGLNLRSFGYTLSPGHYTVCARVLIDRKPAYVQTPAIQVVVPLK